MKDAEAFLALDPKPEFQGTPLETMSKFVPDLLTSFSSSPCSS
jgi:hypothetical protein